MNVRTFLCVLVLAGITLLFMVSCNKKEEQPPDQIMASVSASAQVTQGESSLSCTVVRNPEGVGVISVTQPASLEGLCFEWKGNGYGLSYHGLACEAGTPFLPSTSFASAIMNVLKSCERMEGLQIQSQEDGKTVYSGESESGRFTITVDNQDGFIEKISIEDLQLSVDFTRMPA